MPAKTEDPGQDAGPFHAFRILHEIRPGGGSAGMSSIASALLSGRDALDWIRAVCKSHGLSGKEEVHPVAGTTPAYAEAHALEGTQAAGDAAAAWTQGQLADASNGQQEAAQGAPGDDAPAS